MSFERQNVIHISEASICSIFFKETQSQTSELVLNKSLHFRNIKICFCAASMDSLQLPSQILLAIKIQMILILQLTLNLDLFAIYQGKTFMTTTKSKGFTLRKICQNTVSLTYIFSYNGRSRIKDRIFDSVFIQGKTIQIKHIFQHILHSVTYVKDFRSLKLLSK